MIRAKGRFLVFCTNVFFGDSMIYNIRTGDFIEMKKKHPCGEKKFEVLYAASDVKIRCCGCKREMLLYLFSK